jgi:hypothetical protein
MSLGQTDYRVEYFTDIKQNMKSTGEIVFINPVVIYIDLLVQMSQKTNVMI